MTDPLPGLGPDAFRKVDPSPDFQFYAQPRFVTHIDEPAIAAVTALYAALLPAGGEVLDLMSSWVSHLPATAYAGVAGLGMNAEELAANPRLTEWLVQDLNVDPLLPWPDRKFDAAVMCVSVQYLQRPVEIFRDVHRVLRPGAPFIVSFSNRCFSTKAVNIWRALPGPVKHRLVAGYMQAAGFAGPSVRDFVPGKGDPLWAVIGHTQMASSP